MTTRPLDALPAGVRLGVSPLSWANDVLEDLGADISLETCLDEAAHRFRTRGQVVLPRAPRI